MEPALRANVTKIIQDVYDPDILYALMISRDQIVSLVEPRKFPMKSEDLLLLVNFVNAHAPSFRSSAHLAPICLPFFNDTGFLYAYVHFLLQDLCLVFVTAKDDAFHKLHESQVSVQEALTSRSLLPQLETAISQNPQFSIQTLGFGDLWHFMFKMTALSQVLSDATGHAYTRILDQYLCTLHIVYESADSGADSGAISATFELRLDPSRLPIPTSTSCMRSLVPSAACSAPTNVSTRGCTATEHRWACRQAQQTSYRAAVGSRGPAFTPRSSTPSWSGAKRFHVTTADL
jgi:hypothetical protein